MCAQQVSNVQIEAYKHNGLLHRLWHKNKILKQTDKKIIGYNEATKVTESDGEEWVTREPAIFCFYADYWFNVIAMLKNNGIHYYCNLSSPYTFEDQVIRYIDYDIDISVYPNRNIRLLDKDEYDIHKKEFQYPSELDDILHSQINFIYSLINKGKEPFSTDYIQYWYRQAKNK